MKEGIPTTPDHLQGLAKSYDGKPTHNMMPQGWQANSEMPRLTSDEHAEVQSRLDAERPQVEAIDIVDVAVLEQGNVNAPTAESHVTWGGR